MSNPVGLRHATERAADREEVAALVRELGDRDGVLIRSYSTVGTRGDADFMLWLVSERVDDLHESFSARLNRTASGRLPETLQLLLDDQAEHVRREAPPREPGGRSNRLVIAPTGRRYLLCIRS